MNEITKKTRVFEKLPTSGDPLKKLYCDRGNVRQIKYKRPLLSDSIPTPQSFATVGPKRC